MSFNENVFVTLKSPFATGRSTRICDIETLLQKKNSSLSDSFEIKISSGFDKKLFNNYVIKIGKITPMEIDLLKKSRSLCREIVRMEGYSPFISKTPCILIEKAKYDLSRINRPISNKQTNIFKTFFKNLLSFLKENEIVYCDWTPKNILDFGDETYKLADMESCQKEGIVINHPNNINLLYTSPYLMNLKSKLISFDNSKFEIDNRLFINS
jgi:hypothetical protein